MADVHHPPLNYEASANRTHPQVSTSLPPEVSACLKNARFLHLATISMPSSPSSPPVPHVSLMNYTFLASSPYHPHPTIIMTTNAQSLKTKNLLSNPNVSLLVHDWVSHRPPTTTPRAATGRDGSPPAAATRSSLASLLLNLNTSALSSISTTITGVAQVVERGSEEESWCKEAHLANNTFGEEGGEFGGGMERVESLDNAAGASSYYIEGDDVRVVVVRVREGRIADWKGGVKDWMVVNSRELDEANPGGPDRGRRGDEPLVNGIIH